MVHTFLWKLCLNALPKKINLYNRKIVTDSLCPMYCLLPKSIVHAIWDCAASRAVWMECNRRIQKLSIVEDDGMSLFERLMDKLDEDNLTLVSCLARRIWLQGTQ